MHKLLIEKAQTAFENRGGEFIASKSRFGDVIIGGVYSESFVEQYAKLNEDVVVVSVKGVAEPVSFGDWVSECNREVSESLMKSFGEITSRKITRNESSRDSIIEKAKRDVKSRKFVFDTNERRYIDFEFIVNKEKRTIVALGKGRWSGASVLRKGIAKCDTSDCFNVHIGKAIALRRALGHEVPSEYYNAPQPTEVRVGDVVSMGGRRFIRTFQVTDIDGGPEYLSARIHEGNGKIIDDSRE